jgi:hypothetical protein
MTPIPFCHGNQSLAIALHIGGCPIMEMRREYTPDDEKRIGLTAGDATRKGVGGKFRFFHQPAPQLAALVAAYDAEGERIKGAETNNITELPDLHGFNPQLAVSIAHQALYVRRRVQEELRNPANSWLVVEKGEPVTQVTKEGKIVTYPGTIIVNGDATPETRKKFNL